MSKKEEKNLVPVKKNTLPVPVKKGDLIIADYGKLGNLEFEL